MECHSLSVLFHRSNVNLSNNIRGYMFIYFPCLIHKTPTSKFNASLFTRHFGNPVGASNNYNHMHNNEIKINQTHLYTQIGLTCNTLTVAAHCSLLWFTMCTANYIAYMACVWFLFFGEQFFFCCFFFVFRFTYFNRFWCENFLFILSTWNLCKLSWFFLGEEFYMEHWIFALHLN